MWKTAYEIGEKVVFFDVYIIFLINRFCLNVISWTIGKTKDSMFQFKSNYLLLTNIGNYWSEEKRFSGMNPGRVIITINGILKRKME
jgi:hypothetical protein